jgi:hypothetical protein
MAGQPGPPADLVTEPGAAAEAVAEVEPVEAERAGAALAEADVVGVAGLEPVVELERTPVAVEHEAQEYWKEARLEVAAACTVPASSYPVAHMVQEWVSDRPAAGQRIEAYMDVAVAVALPEHEDRCMAVLDAGQGGEFAVAAAGKLAEEPGMRCSQAGRRLSDSIHRIGDPVLGQPGAHTKNTEDGRRGARLVLNHPRLEYGDSICSCEVSPIRARLCSIIRS